MDKYREPMEPWKGLEPYASTIHLPESGLELFAYQAGSLTSQPMLLIHGLGDEADTWRYLIPPLSKNFRVIAPDLPGFGRSVKPDLAYSVPFFQEKILEMLDALEIPQVILVGHSLGAAIAHTTALAAPERVSRLVLMAGSLVTKMQKIDPGLLLFMIPGLGEWLYNRLRKDPQAAYRTLEAYYHQLESLSVQDREFLFQRVNQRVWDDDQRRAFFSALRNMLRWVPAQQRSLAERLVDLTVPTLAMWGETDRVNSSRNGQALAEMQPGVRVVIVPGAGHNFHQEKPQAVVNEIEAFL